MGEHYSDAMIREIRQAYADGATQRDLMDRFGVSKAYVHQLVTGKTRLDAGGPISERRTAGKVSHEDNPG